MSSGEAVKTSFFSLGMTQSGSEPRTTNCETEALTTEPLCQQVVFCLKIGTWEYWLWNANWGNVFFTKLLEESRRVLQFYVKEKFEEVPPKRKERLMNILRQKSLPVELSVLKSQLDAGKILVQGSWTANYSSEKLAEGHAQVLPRMVLRGYSALVMRSRGLIFPLKICIAVIRCKEKIINYLQSFNKNC